MSERQAPAHEYHGVSNLLLAAGAGSVALAGVAMAWPGEVLLLAILTVGPLAIAFGTLSVALALWLRHGGSRWQLLVVHGVACVASGTIVLAAPNVSLRAASLLIALWLALYAAFLTRLARLVWRRLAVRWCLLAWAAINLGLAMAAVARPRGTLFALLFLGAFYLAAFGLSQIAAGIWIRRVALRTDTGDMPLQFAHANARPSQ